MLLLKSALVVVLLGLLSTALPAAAEIKIGFVDRERILRESGAAKRAQAKLKKEFTGREAEIEKLEKQGRDLQVMLQKESVTISEADRSARAAGRTAPAHLVPSVRQTADRIGHLSIQYIQSLKIHQSLKSD